MNATLFDSDQMACPSRREVELAALVEKLPGEVAQLRGEVAELRQQVGYWKGMFKQAKRKNEKQQKEIDSLRAENRQLKDRLFAAKSEKKRPQDRSNGLDDSQQASEPIDAGFVASVIDARVIAPIRRRRLPQRLRQK